jgi:hypothetical protein
MDATTASLIGASIGALAGLGGGWLNGWRQSKIEHQKWVRARYDTIEKDARLALADLTKKLAAGVHAICWLTWKAKYEPEKLSEADLSAYDTSMQTLFPDIVGSRVILAALSKETHDLVSPLVLQLYAFDVRVAEGAALFRRSPADGIKVLATCHDDCLQFDRVLLDEVTRIGLPEGLTGAKGGT